MDDDSFLLLMARILLQLSCSIGPIVPYNEWGVDVGRCQYCGVIGKFHYCSDIEYEHKENCLVALVGEMRKRLVVQDNEWMREKTNHE